MSNYAEKFKDPRWQKKRLEIFRHYGFACLRCDNEEEELHAHHRYYEKGRDPWDYPLGAIIPLCASCHERITDALKEVGVRADEPYMLELLELLPELDDALKTGVLLDFARLLLRGEFVPSEP